MRQAFFLMRSSFGVATSVRNGFFDLMHLSFGVTAKVRKRLIFRDTRQ